MLFLNRSFDKKRLKALLLWFRLNLNEGAALKVVEILQELGFRFATQGAISLGLDDLKTPTSKGGRVFQAQLEVALAHHEHHRGNRTPVELFQHLVDTWHRTSQDLTTEVVQLFHSTERINPVYMMAFSGARGNISQVRQLVGMRGLMADPRGQIVGFPILSNFREGLTITEYFVSCYGARKGVVDTAIRTADAGYLTRRLADVSHHVVVRTTNCGTYRSIQLKDIKEGQKTILSLANRLVGRVLAEHISLAPSTTCSTSLHAQRASLVTQRVSGKSQAAVVTHASLRDFGASQAGKPNPEGVVGNPSSLVDESQVELMPKNLEKGKLNVCVSHLPSFVEEKAIGEVEVKSTEFVKQLEDSFGYPKRPIGTQITPRKRSSLCIPCPSTYPNPEGVGQQALCFAPEGASKAEGIGAEVASPIPITPRFAKGRAKQRGNACLLGKPEGYAAGSYPRFAKGEAQLRSRGYRNNPVKYDLQLNPLHTVPRRGCSSPLNPLAKRGVRACEADGNYGRPIWKAYRNSEITPFLASKLALQCLEISVRSPLSCSLPWGVCQLCYGWGLSEGRRVTLGEAVGIIAAQSIGEPGTQLTLRTFHTGGVFSGELLNEIRAPFIGTVYFPKPLQGLLLRTPHGQIAFLAKVFGKMKIYSLNFKQQLLRNPSKPTASLAPSGAKQRACLPEGYAEVRVQENILEYHLLCIPKIGNPLPRRACEAERLGGKFRRGLQSRVYSSSTPKVTREKIVFSHKIKTSDTLTTLTSLFLHTLLRLPKIAFYILPALFPSKVRKKQVYYHFSSRQLLGLQTITTCTTKGGNIARISNYKTSNIANQKWIQSFEKRIELLVRFFTFSKPSRMFREGGNAKRVCKKAPLYADSLLKCTPPLRYSLPASHTRRASYLRVPEGSGSGAAIPLSKAWGELQPLSKAWGTVCRGYRACYYPFGVRYAEDTLSKVRKSKVGYPTIEYTTLFESCAIEVSYATKTKVWLQNAKKSLQLFSSKYIDFLYINSCFALGGKITKSFSREPIDWLQYSSQVSENIPEARSIEQDSVLSPVTSAYPWGQQARRGTACISNPEGVVASSISPKEISLYPEGASEAGVHFSGGMQINKIKNQKAGSKNKQTQEFTIQPSTVLFVRQKEHVYSNQLLAEFSSSTLLPSESKGKTKDQIEMTQQVLSETAGQVWFKEMDYGSRKGPGSGSLGTHFSSQDLGGIWVLAGKPMTNPLTFSDKQLLVVNQSASLLRPLPSFFVKNVLAYPSSYGNQRAQLLEPICFATPRFAKGRAKQGVDPQKETDTINQRHKKESYLPKTPEGASYYPLAKRGVKLQHPTYPEGVRIHFSEDIPTKMNPLLAYPKPLRGKGWRSRQSEGSSPLSKAWACEADGYRKEEGSEPGYVDGSNRILSMHTFRSTRFIDAAKKNCQSCSLYRDTYAAPSSFDVNAGLNIVTMQKTNVYANREFLAYCQLPPLDTFPRRGKRSKPLRGKDALPAVPRSVQPTTHLLRKPLPRRGLGVQGLRSKGIGILPSPSAEFILVKASEAEDAFTKMNSNPLAKRGVGMQVSYFRHLTTPSGLGMERKQGGLCIPNPEGVVASPIPSASLAPIPLSKAWGELQPSTPKGYRGKVCRGYRGERSRGYASANKLFKKSIEKKTVFRKQTIPFLYESDQVTFATDYKKQFSITNFSPSIAISTKNRYAEKEITLFNVFPGQFLAYGDNIINKIVTTESGQVLYINSQKITLRKAQTVLIYSQAIVAVFSEEWIKKGTPLMSLSYQKLVTGDIVQGLPKIEQLFEARMLKDGTFWSGSLQAQLNQFFQEYKEGKNGLFPMPLAEAVRKGFSEIQRVLVEGVQRVYISQGVLIADKHLEVIVRQMTCKGRILYSGDTGFLRNELVSLDKIENVNQVIYGQKALYHPQVRGITDASLESESFLSAASFQETTRVLSRDAIIGKTDLMRGLKERVIVGELIQAGTGLANNSVYSLI